MLIDEVFATWWEQNQDYNKSDMRVADARLEQRQSAIHEWLFNANSFDIVGDTLSDQGFDPAEYLTIIERNIELVIANKILLEDTEFLNFAMS